MRRREKGGFVYLYMEAMVTCARHHFISFPRFFFFFQTQSVQNDKVATMNLFILFEHPLKIKTYTTKKEQRLSKRNSRQCGIFKNVIDICLSVNVFTI